MLIDCSQIMKVVDEVNKELLFMKSQNMRTWEHPLKLNRFKTNRRKYFLKIVCS